MASLILWIFIQAFFFRFFFWNFTSKSSKDIFVRSFIVLRVSNQWWQFKNRRSKVQFTQILLDKYQSPHLSLCSLEDNISTEPSAVLQNTVYIWASIPKGKSNFFFFQVLAEERANGFSNLFQLYAIVAGFIVIALFQVFEIHIHSHSRPWIPQMIITFKPCTFVKPQQSSHLFFKKLIFLFMKIICLVFIITHNSVKLAGRYKKIVL